MQGQLLAQRYYVLGRLGRGSFGTVYLAEDRTSERYVAVKTPVNAREARLLESLTHPQIPRCYGTLSHEDNLLLLMEWIRGETLREYLLGQGEIELTEVHQIMSQVWSIVEGLVEREPAILYPDLHWNNLLRARDGRLWLIDFGGAFPVERSRAEQEAVEALCFFLRTYLLEFLTDRDLAVELFAWSWKIEQQAEGVCDFVEAWNCLMHDQLSAQENARVVSTSPLTS